MPTRRGCSRALVLSIGGGKDGSAAAATGRYYYGTVHTHIPPSVGSRVRRRRRRGVSLADGRALPLPTPKVWRKRPRTCACDSRFVRVRVRTRTCVERVTGARACVGAGRRRRGVYEFFAGTRASNDDGSLIVSPGRNKHFYTHVYPVGGDGL